MTATMTNGRMRNEQQNQPRKQLSDQIDRLDDLVDGLAEHLPAAVADATKEGTRLAVREVLKEILTDPAVLAQFRSLFATQPPITAPLTMPTTVPTPVTAPTGNIEPNPGIFARWKTRIRDGAKTATDRVKNCFAGLRTRVQEVQSSAKMMVTAVRKILPLGRFLLIALLVGLTVAVTSYIAPQGIAAILSGIGGAVVTMTLQVFGWARRSAKSLVWLK